MDLAAVVGPTIHVGETTSKRLITSVTASLPDQTSVHAAATNAGKANKTNFVIFTQSYCDSVFMEKTSKHLLILIFKYILHT